MPSYPIRPTFPIDVRSTPSIAATREGTAFRFDLKPGAASGVVTASRNQFFAALDALMPGATAILASAVPPSASDPINRAFNGTNFVTAGCGLVVFAKVTLSLTDAQMAAVLAAALNITE